MEIREIKDHFESSLSVEEMINHRLQKTARRIEFEQRGEIKRKKQQLDPYFDSIKNWRPI
jgi:hypothetical protein